MRTADVDSGLAFRWWRAAPILAGAFLFNLGQGVLRPTMPLYLRETFSANYRMVTAIPTVFGIGKWAVSLPSGYLLDVLGRRWLMIGGLLLIALSDVASVIKRCSPAVFLGYGALAGVGWAMFGTVATTMMVDLPTVERRGRAVSLLLMAETAGLLIGTAAGGWLYQGAGVASPFAFEAACMVVAALVVGCRAFPATGRSTAPGSGSPRTPPALSRPPRARCAGDEPDQRHADGHPDGCAGVPLSAVPGQPRRPWPGSRGTAREPQRRRPAPGPLVWRARVVPLGTSARTGRRPRGLCRCPRHRPAAGPSGGACRVESRDRRGRRVRGRVANGPRGAI